MSGLAVGPNANTQQVATQLLARLRQLAHDTGKTITISSGYRSAAEQARIYAHPQGYPVARPGYSAHQSGLAVDASIGGVPIQNALPASVLRAHGLYPLPGDAVHVELANRQGGRLFLPGVPAAQQASKKTGGGNLVDNVTGAVAGAAGDVVDTVTGAAGNVAQDAAKTAVSFLVDQFGKDAARAGLWVALITAGLVLAAAGTSRLTGTPLTTRAAQAAQKTASDAATAALFAPK